MNRIFKNNSILKLAIHENKFKAMKLHCPYIPLVIICPLLPYRKNKAAKRLKFVQYCTVNKTTYCNFFASGNNSHIFLQNMLFCEF
jgi:hypothetical protein